MLPTSSPQQLRENHRLTWHSVRSRFYCRRHFVVTATLAVLNEGGGRGSGGGGGQREDVVRRGRRRRQLRPPMVASFPLVVRVALEN